MLSAVLRSDVAIQVSISIMKSFVEMRRFIANNALLFERISTVELRQLEYQKQTDEKLEQIFEYISEHEESSERCRKKVFWNQSNSRCRHHQGHPAKVGTGSRGMRNSLRSQFATLENPNSLNYSGISCEMQVSIGKGFTA